MHGSGRRIDRRHMRGAGSMAADRPTPVTQTANSQLSSAPQASGKSPKIVYPYHKPDANIQPPYLYPPYRSTIHRSPTKPLILFPNTLSEVTGPVFGHDDVAENDNDLTRQHAGEPIGQRISISGRVLDDNGRPVPNTLVEIWQTNAGGRYVHQSDQHPCPLDPEFLHRLWPYAANGCRGPLQICDHKTRRISLAQPSQCLAARTHPFFAFWRRFCPAIGYPNVFPRRSVVSIRPHLQFHSR